MKNRRIHAVLFAVPLFTSLMMLPEAAKAATIYDVVTDFSLTSNPNGVWSYGQEATLGGAFSTLPFADTSNLGLEAWGTTTDYPGADATPYIAHNTTASTVTYTTFSVPANELQLHPGVNGEYAVVRWTSPFATATSISINGLFSSQDNHLSPNPAGTTTDAHVLLNGASLLNTDINGIGVISPYVLNVTVGAGDTIDFAVGYGSNLNHLFDSTGLQAQISAADVDPSATPEPGTLLLLLSGSGLGLLARRRMSR